MSLPPQANVPRAALYWIVGAIAWVLLVMLPFSSAAQHAEGDALVASQDLAEAHTLLPQYKPPAPTPSGAPVVTSVPERINQIATEAGIDAKSLTRLEDVEGAARLSFSTVPGDTVVKFLYQLQSQGLVIESWQMNTNTPGIWTGSGVVRNP